MRIHVFLLPLLGRRLHATCAFLHLEMVRGREHGKTNQTTLPPIDFINFLKINWSKVTKCLDMLTLNICPSSVEWSLKAITTVCWMVTSVTRAPSKRPDQRVTVWSNSDRKIPTDTWSISVQIHSQKHRFFFRVSYNPGNTHKCWCTSTS